MGLSVQCSLLKCLLVKQTGFHIFQLGITLQKLTTFPKHQICEVDKDSARDLWKNRMSGFFSHLLLSSVALPCEACHGTRREVFHHIWVPMDFTLLKRSLLKRDANSPPTEISRSLVLNVGGTRFWFSGRQSSHLLWHSKKQLPIIWVFLKAVDQAQHLTSSPVFG